MGDGNLFLRVIYSCKDTLTAAWGFSVPTYFFSDSFIFLFGETAFNLRNFLVYRAFVCKWRLMCVDTPHSDWLHSLLSIVLLESERGCFNFRKFQLERGFKCIAVGSFPRLKRCRGTKNSFSERIKYSVSDKPITSISIFNCSVGRDTSPAARGFAETRKYLVTESGSQRDNRVLRLTLKICDVLTMHLLSRTLHFLHMPWPQGIIILSRVFLTMGI